MDFRRWPQKRATFIGFFVASLLAVWPCAAKADSRLLNVSFDISREFYDAYNPLFAQHALDRGLGKVAVEQSHGGSAKQTRAVLDGLEADVVTLNQASDLDQLAQRGGLVSREWRTRFPSNSAPFTSPIVFLVRKGNPKSIRDWPDLVRPGISVVLPNPRTSGNGRYSYLAAYAAALAAEGGTPATARAYLEKLFRQVPVVDVGGRAATATFAQRGIGDVLLTFEAEALLSRRELGTGAFEIVLPSRSLEAEMPVAVVETNAKRHGTEVVAQAYLLHLYSEEAQELAARHFFRPRLESVRARHRETFPALTLVSIDSAFGGWAQVQRDHFAPGALLDQLTARQR
jgi:sulfate transport system substrate-binding protein